LLEYIDFTNTKVVPDLTFTELDFLRGKAPIESVQQKNGKNSQKRRKRAAKYRSSSPSTNLDEDPGYTSEDSTPFIRFRKRKRALDETKDGSDQQTSDRCRRETQKMYHPTRAHLQSIDTNSMKTKAERLSANVTKSSSVSKHYARHRKADRRVVENRNLNQSIVSTAQYLSHRSTRDEYYNQNENGAEQESTIQLSRESISIPSDPIPPFLNLPAEYHDSANIPEDSNLALGPFNGLEQLRKENQSVFFSVQHDPNWSQMYFKRPRKTTSQLTEANSTDGARIDSSIEQFYHPLDLDMHDNSYRGRDNSSLARPGRDSREKQRPKPKERASSSVSMAAFLSPSELARYVMLDLKTLYDTDFEDRDDNMICGGSMDSDSNNRYGRAGVSSVGSSVMITGESLQQVDYAPALAIRKSEELEEGEVEQEPMTFWRANMLY
jgi:hypothetical protein